jgi:3-hydroxyisobutyrate dehydrogenase-like beta-hydroxyacid dehydrogenase
MLEEALGLGVALPLTTRALDCYDALARDGLGGSDATMLPAHWLRQQEH